MKKKSVLLITSVLTASVCVGVMVFSIHRDDMFVRGDSSYKMTLSGANKEYVKSADGGYLHQITIKKNKFDLVGWSSEGGAFGSIKQDVYGSYTYKGMIYNRSAINGFKKLTVDFVGGNLYYVFTDFLMENMDFDKSNPLVTEQSVQVPANEGYFIVYTDSTSPVNINSLEVEYECNHNIDSEMIYDKTTSLGGARSVSKTFVKEDSYLELENNPTSTTNNYSPGQSAGHGNKDAWYRFNGKYFTSSGNLGTEFKFGMTIVGDYEYMIDQTKNFHYNVWPQFAYGNASDEPWVQTYIGNDNYEPRGKGDPLRPDDPYAQESYAGRFFTNYDWYNSSWVIDYDDPTGKWTFADPDNCKIPDGSMTFREAYQRYNLPFWFLEFHVYLDGDNDPMCDIKINGLTIYSSYIFENYDTVNTPDIYIKTLPCHLINYGVDVNGTPDTSYKGYFTYPRLIA